MNKKIKKLKGISLIVLVITILVLSILAATVIISLSNTNIISGANKAVLKSNIQSLQDRVTSYTADNYTSIDMKKEYTLSEYGITEEEFKKYQTIAVVKGGKIYIKPNASSDILEVAKELNVLLDATFSNTGSLELASTKVKSLRIYGNSIQNGTPSESTPVEIQSVGEKTTNEFLSSYMGNMPGGVTATYDELTNIYTINGTTEKACNIILSFEFIPNIEVGENVFLTSEILSGTIDGVNGTGKYLYYSMFNDSQSKWIRNGSTFLTSAGKVTAEGKFPSGSYMSYMVQAGGAGITFNNVKLRVQLEKVKTSTEYEPYGYKVPITVCDNLVFKPQIGSGDTATEYEPYNATTYNIYLKEPLRKLGSTADYIDCTTGEVVRYIKVKDTTGTKSIEESFEVLTTPITEKVSVSDIDYTNKKYVSVDTTVTPSSIEARY